MPRKGCTWLDVEHRKAGHFLRFNNDWELNLSELPDHEVFYQLFLMVNRKNLRRNLFCSHLFFLATTWNLLIISLWKLQNFFANSLRELQVHFRTIPYENIMLDQLSNIQINKILNHCSRINYFLLDVDIMNSKCVVELLSKSLEGQVVDRIQFKTIYNINKATL